MNSPQRVSFNRPNESASIQASYNYNNPNVPQNHQSNFYEIKQTSVPARGASPVDLSQKPNTIFVGRSPPVQQIPRAEYQKTYNRPPSKRLAPENDPVPKQTCCTPVWWIIAALIGTTGLILALLFGLRVIGAFDPQKVASTGPAVRQTSNAPTYTTSSSTSKTGAPSNTSPAATTTVSLTPGSVAPQTITTSTTTTTTTHHSIPQPQSSLRKVTAQEQHRHRLPVEEGPQKQ